MFRAAGCKLVWGAATLCCVRFPEIILVNVPVILSGTRFVYRAKASLSLSLSLPLSLSLSLPLSRKTSKHEGEEIPRRC